MHAAREEQELPNHLVGEVELILRRRDIFHGRTQKIEELIHMLEVYDTYAQTGYTGKGVDSAILQGALNRMHAQDQPWCR
ncbi:MAG: GSU3529 family protein [Desulfuromonadaceae bacterium]